MDDEERFIPAIHNYCDRWCERCEFTSRCRVFDMEREMTAAETDVSDPAFYRNLTNTFANVKEQLIEKAREFGIDIDAVSDEEYSAIRAREDAVIESSEITRLAGAYARGASQLLESREEWTETAAEPDEMQDEVIEVLRWYQFFISAKLQRALHGTLDLDGDEDPGEIDDPQSDANGSAKIGLIAVERSILAWTYLISPGNRESVGPMIRLLENLRGLAEQKFPNAHDFVRPGFDEIETVM